MPRRRGSGLGYLDRHLTAKEAAVSFGVSERTARKWLARFRAEGATGLQDRSSRPLCSPRQTPAAQVAVVLALRRLRLPGFQIARQSGLSRATVSRLLRRHGLARLSTLEPAPPVVRYQRQHPGELLHFDIKKLGRFMPALALCLLILALCRPAKLEQTSAQPTGDRAQIG